MGARLLHRGDRRRHRAHPARAPRHELRPAGVERIKWVTWLVVGGAVLATCVVAIALSGGWPVAITVIAIWVLALAALLST